MISPGEAKEMVGKKYSDRHGINVTVTKVERVQHGYSVTISNGKHEAKMSMQTFGQRGFKVVEL